MVDSNSRRRYLGLCATGAGAVLAGCSGFLPGSDGETNSGDETVDEEVDDWQYSPEEDADRASSSGGAQASYSSTAGGDGGSVGLAAGGANDIAAFRNNVREGYLPLPASLSYEGLFYNYYFETGGDDSCSSLFCPRYTPAVTPDPLSGETERYLTVGLDSGLSQSAFERKKLNLVVVLDISGSMSSQFDQYYYDRFGNRKEVEGDTDRQKIAVARDALVTLTEQLQPEDRLGVVLFDDRSVVAKPMRTVESTDMEAIREHIQEDIEPRGGTDIEAGIDEATGMLEPYEDADPSTYENRTILLTDAMPNLGDTSASGLRGTLESNAERGLNTSFVGIGVDFNAELVDRITAIRGANYYSVHSADEFEQRMGEEFEYMVTPLVYDLSLELDAAGYDIKQVYGSSAAEEATGEILYVNTLFPSPSRDGQARGGVVLVQVERQSSDASMTLRASWETRTGTTRSSTDTISFPGGDTEQFGNTSVRKAVLLSRYGDLLKNWMVAEREGGERVPDADDGIAVPPDDLGRWEQQSESLTVSEPYEQRIRTFQSHFEEEMAAIGDDSLDQEVEMLETILAAG